MRESLYVNEFNAAGVDLRGKSSGQIKTKCPVCSKSRKNNSDLCLSVNIDTGAYNCHNCDNSGNIHKWKSRKPEYVKPEWNNKTELTDNVVKWFEGRRISQATLKRMKITEGEEYMPQIQKKANTIQFNYFRNGELINTKFRDGNKNFKMVKDAERIWYNFDGIGKEVVIVEGEMDVLSFVECGINNCISVPNGASNFNFGEIDGVESVIIAVDSDEPGRKLEKELIRRFGAEICKKIDWGPEKDANGYLVKYGKMKFMDSVMNMAEDVPVSGVMFAHSYFDELIDLRDNGLQPGAKTRHTELNNYITFETGRIMMVTGIPGHGKSEFVDDILVDLSVGSGWRIGYFSPENWPIQWHISKIISKLSGSWIHKLTTGELDYYSRYVNDNFFWVMPDDSFGISTILSKARYLVKRFGIKAFVIDPWNTLETDIPSNMTETQFISKILGQLSIFARQNDILLIIVAHPRKMDKNKDDEFEVPNLYSINGSSHFFNKTDYGVTIFRRPSDDVEIHVQKVKFRHLGGVGKVRMVNNVSNGRYQEMDSANAGYDNRSFLLKPIRN